MARQLDVRYIQFYTDGSAARKVEPIAPIKTLKIPRVKKQKRIVLQIDPIATVGIIVSVLMLILMAVGVAHLKESRERVAAMEAYVDTLQDKNASLRATYENGYDLEAVEKTALALGLVPREQVTKISIRVPAVEDTQEPGAWERFCTFLAGLFA